MNQEVWILETRSAVGDRYHTGVSIIIVCVSILCCISTINFLFMVQIVNFSRHHYFCCDFDEL